MKYNERSQDMTDFSQTDVTRHYSRTAKLNEEKTIGKPSPYKVSISGKHRFYLFIFSLLVGAINVGLPVLNSLANLTQSQHLYTGLMLTKGLLPYGDIFATGGILYYALVAASYVLGSSAWLTVVQVLAFYVSGAYFYRLVAYLTHKQDLALVASLSFYLLNLSMGFGGLYPVQFALPFVLIGLWFLTKYFHQSTPDESFMLYGFLGAISILLEPRTLTFWFLSAVFVFIVNLRRKEKAKGVYQLLCLIFGSILVFYSGAYFLINLQILSPYFSQAIIYHLSVLVRGTADLWQSLGAQLLLALFGGLLLGLLGFLKKFEPEATKSSPLVRGFLFLMLLVSLPYALGAQTFEPYALLDGLIYGLLLTVLWLNQRQEKVKQSHSHRRVKAGQVDGRLFAKLLKSHLYLPILVFVFGIAYPIWQAFDQQKFVADRIRIAQYLKKTVTEDEKIYVWDNQPKIYADSQLTPSSQLILPVGYASSSMNNKTLEDELLQNQANYIVVNKQMKLSDDLKKDLQTNYKALSVAKVSNFTVYQLK
ncbi:DUF2079 domain-containing protein [Streptococcus sp. sy004]|uniref:DUF2079 domain-containing protein n=1 Tax=Streptococcus sp. sy004 TaxID=2600149 RepID=UPI0011B3A097|nr:DUF2079 domain-containing protein [Streptococcus sp. sy004]TWT09831.1 DUF2079 domain-containing protein [Streptococcus sp. sy004]